MFLLPTADTILPYPEPAEAKAFLPHRVLVRVVGFSVLADPQPRLEGVRAVPSWNYARTLGVCAGGDLQREAEANVQETDVEDR
jgi:hypothetical protein